MMKMSQARRKGDINKNLQILLAEGAGGRIGDVDESDSNLEELELVQEGEYEAAKDQEGEKQNEDLSE